MSPSTKDEIQNIINLVYKLLVKLDNMDNKDFDNREEVEYSDKLHDSIQRFENSNIEYRNS